MYVPVIIAYKDKNAVHIASDTQTTYGSYKSSNLGENNFKVFKPIGLDSTLIGFAGDVSEKSLLMSYNFDLLDIEIITFEIVVQKIIPKILEAIEQYGIKYDLEKENINSEILIITKDKIFLIKSDLCVYEIKDLISIGSGRVVASGAFYTLNHLNIKERLIKSVEVASKIKNGVAPPFVYINNKDLKFEVILGGL